MPMSIDQALAACIEAVERGMSVEQCLALYPEYAVELEPVLRMVARAHAMQSPPMSDAAFARGRRRVAAAARAAQQARSDARHQEARHQWKRPHLMTKPVDYRPGQAAAAHGMPELGNYHAFVVPAGLVDEPAPGGSSPIRSRPRQKTQPFFPNWPAALSAGIAACLVLGAIWFSTVVGNSLPGSPLYTLKRGTEQAQDAIVSTLAPGSEIHAYWVAHQAEQRLTELVALEAAGVAVAPEWQATAQSQVLAALAAGLELAPEERVYYLDEWLATLRMLEQAALVARSSDMASAPHAMTYALVTAAVSDVEQLLIQADLVVLAPTPTSTLAPDLSPNMQPSVAQVGADSTPDRGDTAPTAGAQAVAIAGSPAPGSPTEGGSSGAAGSESAGEQVESAGPLPAASSADEDSTPDTSAESAPDSAGGQMSASGADAQPETGNGASQTQNATGQTGGGTSLPSGTAPTATPRPPGFALGTNQPIPTPSPTWTPDPGPDRPTAIALADVPRELAVTPDGTGTTAEVPGRADGESQSDEGGETTPGMDAAGGHSSQTGETAIGETGTGGVSNLEMVTPTATITATVTATVTLTPTLTSTATVVVENGTPVPPEDAESGTNPDDASDPMLPTPSHGDPEVPVEAGDAAEDADATPTLIPTYTPSATPTPTPSPTPTSFPTPVADATPVPTATPAEPAPVEPPAVSTSSVEAEPTATPMPTAGAASDESGTDPARLRFAEEQSAPDATTTPAADAAELDENSSPSNSE